MSNRLEKSQFHRFLDEAGDTTFYGKGRVPILGREGVSNYFLLGMLTINESLSVVRNKIIELQDFIIKDPYLINVPSIHKSRKNVGYFLHAKNDIPEVRKLAFELIKSIDCKFDIVVGKKDYNIYEIKHNGSQAEFYADMLSHLLLTSISSYDKLVLNIASRSLCTTHFNLERGLQKAILISKYKNPTLNDNCEIKFNVQMPIIEPLLNIADYFLGQCKGKLSEMKKGFLSL